MTEPREVVIAYMLGLLPMPYVDFLQNAKSPADDRTGLQALAAS